MWYKGVKSEVSVRVGCKNTPGREGSSHSGPERTAHPACPQMAQRILRSPPLHPEVGVCASDCVVCERCPLPDAPCTSSTQHLVLTAQKGSD